MSSSPSRLPRRASASRLLAGALALGGPLVACAQPGRDGGRAPVAARQSAGGEVVQRVPGPYERALRLVEAGEGRAGRALADSLVAAAAAGSPARAEALWWRAVLAADADDAARDWRTIVAEHAESPRAADAARRLQQLARLRGPTPERAVAVAPTPRPAPEPVRTPAPPPTPTPAQTAASTSATPAPAAPTAPAPTAPSPAPSPAATPPVAAPPSAPAAPRRPAASPSFAVQLAAYDTRAGAEAAARRLAARGFDAYVSADAPPYRVRVGRHATRAAATAALRTLKARGLDGFVAAEPAAPATPEDGR